MKASAFQPPMTLSAAVDVMREAAASMTGTGSGVVHPSLFPDFAFDQIANSVKIAPTVHEQLSKANSDGAIRLQPDGECDKEKEAALLLQQAQQQPTFSLGAAEPTALMTGSSPPATAQTIASRPKAVPRSKMGKEKPSTSSSSSSMKSHAVSEPIPMQKLPQTRKRGTPTPPDFDKLRQILPPAGIQVGIAPPMPPPPVIEEDDEIQVISQKINRRYVNHNDNVVYNITLREHHDDLVRRGYATSSHQAMVLRLRYIAEHTVRSLNEFGWAVVDNFMGPEHCKFVSKEIEKLYHKGLFTAGQLMETGEKGEKDIKDVRSDNIYWYDGVDPRAIEAVTVRLLLSMIDALMLQVSRRIEDQVVGGRSRAMIAIYPGGQSKYIRHVDNPNKDGRLITVIYYANPDWNLDRDGGALRLYPRTSTTPMDVDPKADRIVFFWSDHRNPHEVLGVNRHRLAVTLWYMEKNERMRAIRRRMGLPEEATEEELKKATEEAKGEPQHLQAFEVLDMVDVDEEMPSTSGTMNQPGPSSPNIHSSREQEFLDRWDSMPMNEEYGSSSGSREEGRLIIDEDDEEVQRHHKLSVIVTQDQPGELSNMGEGGLRPAHSSAPQMSGMLDGSHGRSGYSTGSSSPGAARLLEASRLAAEAPAASASSAAGSTVSLSRSAQNLLFMQDLIRAEEAQATRENGEMNSDEDEEASTLAKTKKDNPYKI